VFWSAERHILVVEYYIENPDGSFSAYLDESANAKIDIDHVAVENSNLKVTFDRRGFPTIHNTLLVKHHATPPTFAIGDLIYTGSYSRIVAREFVHPSTPQNSDGNPIDIKYSRKYYR